MAKVFISYSHDSAEHSERVLRFADALRGHGVDAEIDQYHVRPPQGWPAWCEEHLRPEVSSHVLMICTQTYHDRVQNQVSDEGRGVFWEGRIIHNYLFGAKYNDRFIPVLFDGATIEHIPIPVRHDGHYRITEFDLTDPGYEALYRDLTGQPYVRKPGVGDIVPVAVRQALTTLPRSEGGAPRDSAPEEHMAPNDGILVGGELAVLDAAWSGSHKGNIAFSSVSTDDRPDEHIASEEERPPEKPRCIACQKELGKGAHVCEACNTLQVPSWRCPKCHKFIPDTIRNCRTCEPSFRWRKWLILVPVIGLLIAALSYGIERIIRSFSHPKMRVLGTSAQPIAGTNRHVQTLTIEVTNGDGDKSMVQQDFVLEFERARDGHLMTFGPLTLNGQDRLRVIEAGGSQRYELYMPSLKPACDITSDDFLKHCGEIKVVLKGTIEESDSEVPVPLKDTAKLREIRDFLLDRRFPLSVQGECQCDS